MAGEAGEDAEAARHRGGRDSPQEKARPWLEKAGGGC